MGRGCGQGAAPSPEAAPFDPHEAVPVAINLIKRTFLKVTMASRNHVAVVVPRESVEKLATAIDPARRMYPAPVGNFIFFNGVAIVCEEAGDAGRLEAQAWLKDRGFA